MTTTRRASEKDEERKKAGWLAALLRGGEAATMGTGGVGAAGISAAGSALLAGKAGLILAAAAVGTVAAAMAALGYRSAKLAAAERLARERAPVFAQKPSEEDPSGLATSGSADGPSASLSMLVAGNAARGYTSYAKDNVVTAAMSAPQAAPASAAAKNGADVSGNKAAEIRASLQTVKVEAAGASAAAGAASASGTSPATAMAAISKSMATAASGAKPIAAFGVHRALSARHFGASNALRALGDVRHDQIGAASSQSAGLTYDGATPSPAAAAMAAVQAAQAAVGASGPGAGQSLGAQANALAPPPPEARSRNATPWQKAVNTAMMCVLGAAACLMIISKIKFNPMLKPVVLVLAGVAAMLSTVTIAMGSMLMSGKYGQTFQGKMFTLSGALMLAASASAVVGLDAMGGGGTGKGGDVSAAAAEESGSASLWMIAAGSAAIGAAMVGYLSQPKVVNDPYFKGSTPDWDHTGKPTTQYKAPDATALERYLA